MMMMMMMLMKVDDEEMRRMRCHHIYQTDRRDNMRVCEVRTVYFL